LKYAESNPEAVGTTHHQPMNTKSKPQATETKPERDQATFEKLPEQTKELMKLKDQEEKTTGTEQVVITKQIQDKARKSRP